MSKSVLLKTEDSEETDLIFSSFQWSPDAMKSFSLSSFLSRPPLALTSRSVPLKAVTMTFLDPTITPMFTQALLINGVLSIALKFSKQKSLSPEGLIHATILGIGLWTFLSIQGWGLCVLYLVLGSLATKVKMQEKAKLGIAEKREGARGPENVWGSAAVAMICALLTYVYPTQASMLKIGFVASLATKLSDTLGSEIGKAYGKTTYLITTLKKVPRGTEGAVSLEGTLAGIIGSVLFSFVALATGLLTSLHDVGACVVAAFIATTAESYVGATFQDNVPWLTNELVNLLNTLIGAMAAVIIAQYLPV